ncbi:MAG: AmmeMemoRadiSam system radical SAM enzyme [Thermoleophilia bacterium]|nr:AmmeMemoRadiSam system radical SAM enzyme [Thermoleophilia bacterium]
MTDQGTSAATAALWESFRGGPVVHCYLCAHHCRVAPGDRGLCGVRENREGVLYTLTYACPISAGIDPIEKKPLFHFLPGSSSFSIATVGCNFVCLFCQNADISQMPRDQGVVRGMHMEPREVVERALAGRCRSISYTYTEPTIYFEFADACARLADAAGLKNVFVTNGYMTRQALEAIDGRLHAANVDLKSFSDDFYRRMVGARLKPVLDSIRRLVAMGVWVEVTTLLIPGENDSEDELRRLAGFLVDLDPNVPWHVSRFHPTYRLRDVPPTPVASVRRAVAIGYEMGLRYVYAGNVPGEPSESTRCPKCGHLVIERRGFMVERMRLDGDRCRDCGTTIPLVLEGKGGH